MQSTALQGESLFRVHWFCWKLLGQVPTASYTNLYYLYSFVLNVVVTLWYPMHLMLGLFNSETSYDMFKNLAINLTCLACTIKCFIIWWKQDKIRQFQRIVTKLDRRVVEPADCKYYKKKVFPAVLHVLYTFYFFCLGTAITSEVSVIISGFLSGWRLMYPAYFPFDPYSSAFKHVIAHLYQILGVSTQIMQNLTNDTIGGMGLALLAGHVRLLGMRVARIGHDAKKTRAENNAELLQCIQDHKDLLEYHLVMQDIISLGMFVQIIFAGVNMCVVIIFILFYVKDAFSLIYYVVYLFAMPMEIFPCCYYGTSFEMEFEKLTYTILSCNWQDQNREFKQNLRIFAEQSLKKINAMAGGMFRINLDTFFATCKTAYSLFAVLVRMK